HLADHRLHVLSHEKRGAGRDRARRVRRDSAVRDRADRVQDDRRRLMSTYAEVVGHLDGDEAVARDDVRRWIDSGDLLTWAAVYALTRSAWSRIHPEIPGDE